MAKVVFACAENKKRSQLAEAIFNHLARQSQSISGGTFPAHKIDPLTIKSLKEIGLPTKNLYPKRLNDSDLNSADVIVSFGCLNPYLFPKGKFQEWQIKDPETIEEFRQARNDITDRIKKLLKQIDNN
ncbi:low molecular weight phosphatase family protein [Patescibacteria group bacterium]|nr:low molecular weight phosphatase family protein [Patescibacteria group bacterium]